MRDPAPWQKRYERMLLLALLFGLISQYLFVGAPAGISVLVFIAAFYGLFFYSVKGRMGGFEKWQGQASSGLLFNKLTDTPSGPAAGSQEAVFKQSRRLEWDPITAGTLLITINLVYVLFVFIQFSYLFGAANGLLPEGAAYADYARRGFAELILVALINVGLLMCGLHLIRRTSAAAERVRKLSLSVLICCTLVMLVSAFSRLSLYEEAYGFSQTRLLVHGFMLYLGVLLAIAMLRIWREHFSMGKAYICVSIIAFVAMNYVNLDARIAAKNIDRFERTGNIDIAYLGTLSTDAAPVLLKLQAKHPKLAGLNEVIVHLQEQARSHNKWQSWSLSKQRAK